MDMQELVTFIRKLFTLYQIHRWEREAVKATRMYQPWRADFALDRIQELSRSL